ncbi:hypothetical protein EVAR_28452_1 [Eumeta japonica]|uniref:Uncharacterized protein n=1 Tax=Eumeta variegata TaxID=151549 RepID=A0A4C1V9L6_EUMVA|nr:hypothetical protein EVAR_28452_1 [Eumeta japonica]
MACRDNSAAAAAACTCPGSRNVISNAFTQSVLDRKVEGLKSITCRCEGDMFAEGRPIHMLFLCKMHNAMDGCSLEFLRGAWQRLLVHGSLVACAEWEVMFSCEP